MKSNAISSIALGQSESLFNSIGSSSNKQAKIYRDRQREREIRYWGRKRKMAGADTCVI